MSDATTIHAHAGETCFRCKKVISDKDAVTHETLIPGELRAPTAEEVAGNAITEQAPVHERCKK